MLLTTHRFNIDDDIYAYLSVPSHALNYTLSFPSANLMGIALIGSYLNNAVLQRVNFDNGLFIKTNFHYATIGETSFKNSTCIETDFRKSNITSSDFSYAILTHAKFSHMPLLSNTFFTQSYCENTIFSFSKLENIYFQGAFFKETVFSSFKGISFNSINNLLGEQSNWLTGGWESTLIQDTRNGELVYIISNENYESMASKFQCQSMFLNIPWRISICNINSFLDHFLWRNKKTITFLDNTFYSKLISFIGEKNINAIEKKLINLKKLYSEHSELEYLFKKLSFEDQQLAKKYFTDFDDFPIEENNDNLELES